MKTSNFADLEPMRTYRDMVFRNYAGAIFYFFVCVFMSQRGLCYISCKSVTTSKAISAGKLE